MRFLDEHGKPVSDGWQEHRPVTNAVAGYGFHTVELTAKDLGEIRSLIVERPDVAVSLIDHLYCRSIVPEGKVEETK